MLAKDKNKLYSVVGKMDSDTSWIMEPMLMNNKDRANILMELREDYRNITIYPRTDIEEFPHETILGTIGEKGLEDWRTKGSISIVESQSQKKIANGFKQVNKYFEIPKCGVSVPFSDAISFLSRMPNALCLEEPQELEKPKEKKNKE